MLQPNIVIVVLDTARAKNFSCYGYHRSTTPFLERMCRNSNLFINAFTAAIWTIPSHASIFTGTYPSRHGALNLHRFLDQRYVTLADLLSKMAYDTVAFSNNGFISLKDFGLSRGFREIEGFIYPKKKLKKAFYKAWLMLQGLNDSGAFATNQFVKQWLRNRGDSKKPFFLFLNYMEAHAPYVNIPRRYLMKYLTPSEGKLLKTINQDTQKYLTKTLTMVEKNFEILRGVYDAQISYLDFTIENLIGILKSHRAWDNSIVIITADHGDLIGEHGLVHHSYSVHEELIKIPLIVKLPGTHDNGKILDHLVSLVDIFPTVTESLEIGDEKLKEQLQGQNLFDDNKLAREYVYIECERPKNEFAKTYPEFDFSVYDRQLLAIRSNRYKYIWASDNRHELFDLAQDPLEQNNLVKHMPERAREMEHTLMKWYSSFDKAHVDQEGQEIVLDQKIKDQLKALGYF